MNIMTPSSSDQRVIVIGGGILGTSTAMYLARGGAQVTLVTSGALADGASSRSIAWLNSSGARSAEYHYLRMLAMDRYRTWRTLHPESHDYIKFNGAIKWAGPGESFRQTFEFERSGGYDSRWIERADVPSVAPDVALEAVASEGAIYNQGEGWVNLPDFIPALVAEATANGATVIENAGDVRVEVLNGQAVGAKLEDGTLLSADRVVLATGGDVPAQLAALGVNIPDSTPAAFVLFTDPVNFDVKTVLNTPRVAIRPTPDGRLVLDADWSEKTLAVEPDGSYTVPEETIQGLLSEASKVLAGNPTLTAHKVGAGLKPIPGDGEPVVGPVSDIDGLFTLFTHSGATLGLILGELVAEEILYSRPSPVLSAFRLDRFDSTEPTTNRLGHGAWTPVAK